MGTESRLTDALICELWNAHSFPGLSGQTSHAWVEFARAVESAVRSQDEALLRQAREALQNARDELAREVGLPVAACVGGAFRPINAALSALNARLGDSDQEKSDASK